jgi:hypothetical protein
VMFFVSQSVFGDGKMHRNYHMVNIPGL